MTEQLRFEILGELRVLSGGRTVDLGPAKQRAVLAVLLLQANRPVQTHRIVDAVWGDEPPENGANVVQKYVAGLRRVLDPDRAPRTPGEVLASTGGGYVLHVAPGALDTADFQAATARAAAEHERGRLAEAAGTLRAALDRWRGPALAGLTGAYFDAARLRLTETHATAWETWAEIELARGRSATLIPELSRLVEEFPLREGLRTSLMIALYQSDRQAEALDVYRRARSFLVEEFGAEPGERMQDAHRRILRGEPFPVAPADPWAGQDPTTPHPFVVPSVVPRPRPPADAAIPRPPAAGAYSRPPADVSFSRPPADATSRPFAVPPASPYPPWLVPAKPKVRTGRLALAVLLPLISCSILGWLYFVIAAVREHRPRLYLVAALYAVLTIVGVVLMAIDPTPVDAPQASDAETLGFLTLMATGIAAAVHGGVTVAHSGGTEREWMLREQLRRFAALEPARAVQLGVGRPDLPRPFDDGLIDINHVTGVALASAARLRPADAYRIVADRNARGPFHRPDDLVTRGLVSAKTMRRLHRQLIAIPTAPRTPR